MLFLYFFVNNLQLSIIIFVQRLQFYQHIIKYRLADNSFHVINNVEPRYQKEQLQWSRIHWCGHSFSSWTGSITIRNLTKKATSYGRCKQNEIFMTITIYQISYWKKKFADFFEEMYSTKQDKSLYYKNRIIRKWSRIYQ